MKKELEKLHYSYLHDNAELIFLLLNDPKSKLTINDIINFLLVEDLMIEELCHEKIDVILNTEKGILLKHPDLEKSNESEVARRRDVIMYNILGCAIKTYESNLNKPLEETTKIEKYQLKKLRGYCKLINDNRLPVSSIKGEDGNKIYCIHTSPIIKKVI